MVVFSFSISRSDEFHHRLCYMRGGHGSHVVRFLTGDLAHITENVPFKTYDLSVVLRGNCI